LASSTADSTVRRDMDICGSAAGHNQAPECIIYQDLGTALSNLNHGHTHTSTVHLLETQGWMRKTFSEPADPYINRSVLRSAFHCTFYFLQQSSFRLFIARSLLSPVPVNPTQALK
ncbi:hypothetical protein N9K45_00375, partial [bacterium]|nr:hypothetical protein [bacterium]MDA8532057.1 hypothetical protein [bacterium]